VVTLVLVSHSRRLAEGVAELLAQVGGPDARVLVAAGTDDGGIGTSPDAVTDAVTAGLRDGGEVVVIPDLGSAVLSVRLALEDADPGRAVLVDAPFVEGAVAAGVTAATGGSLAEVVAAAEQAYEARKT